MNILTATNTMFFRAPYFIKNNSLLSSFYLPFYNHNIDQVLVVSHLKGLHSLPSINPCLSRPKRFTALLNLSMLRNILLNLCWGKKMFHLQKVFASSMVKMKVWKEGCLQIWLFGLEALKKCQLWLASALKIDSQWYHLELEQDLNLVFVLWRKATLIPK